MTDVEDGVFRKILDHLRRELTVKENDEIDVGRNRVWNRLSLEDLDNPELAYDFSYPKKGFCLIFNQCRFSAQLQQNTRSGTDKDRDAMKDTFQKLGYEVHVYDDKCKRDIYERLYEFSQHKDLENMSSFVFVMLSHGYEDKVFAYDDEIKVDHLVGFFKGNKCPSLLGKPKLFIFQACRGDEFDHGTNTIRTDASQTIDIPKLPVEADILIAYSTVAGYFSWRNNQNGSWFIQNLSSALNTYWNSMDFQAIATLTNRMVAYKCASATNDYRTDNMKQVPSIVSQLCKKVYFYQRIEAPKPASGDASR